jgi:hypothetical protein
MLEAPDAALLRHADAVADGQRALLPHGQLGRNHAVELLAVAQHAATSAAHAEDDSGALQIPVVGETRFLIISHELLEDVADGRTLDGVAMLVEQRLPVVLGDALLAHHALVLAEGLADLARSFFGFHLVVREVLFEVLLELLGFTIHVRAKSRGLFRV